VNQRRQIPIHLVALAAITAAGAALRFAGIGDQSFWYDEYQTTVHISHGFVGTLREVATGIERELPLYFVCAWVWERIFGGSEAALRSLSAVAGTLTIPVAYAVVRELASRRAGLIAAAIVAVNPFLVWYSQEARTYAVLVLVCSLSFLFFLRVLSEPGSRTLAGWSIFSALAVTTHYFAWLFVAVEATWLLAALAAERRRVLIACLFPAAVTLALVPLLFHQKGGIAWVADIPLGYRLWQLPAEWATGYSDPATWILLVELALAATAIALVVARSSASELRGARIAGGVALAGLGAALVAAAIGSDYMLPRYMLPFWMPFAAAIAIGLGASRARAAGVAVAAALCALSLALTLEVASTDTLQRPDWRRVARLVGTSTQRRLVTTPAFRQSFAVLHYLDGAALLAPQQAARVSEIDVVDYRESSRGRDYKLCWWGAVCILPRRDEARFRVPAAFHLADRRRSGRYSVRVYRAPRPRPVRASVVGDRRSAFVQAPPPT
jgi:mannosyltransferase